MEKGLKFTLRNMHLEADGYGKFSLVIKQVGVYNSEGKFIKNAKINEALAEALEKRILIKED